MDVDLIGKFVTYLVPMLLSLTIHEYSHALAAWWLGDDTASMQGRMTLNPIAHVDPIGTLLVPAIGIFSGFPFFGWAKPVPTNPVRYTRVFFGKRISMTAGMAVVAAAGPASNLVFAFVTAGALGIAVHIVPPAEQLEGLYALGVRLMAVNVGLCVFNLLPVPPLDGSRILYWLLPERHKPIMDTLARNTPIVFLGLILLMNTSIFYTIIGRPFVAILQVLASLFGLYELFHYLR